MSARNTGLVHDDGGFVFAAAGAAEDDFDGEHDAVAGLRSFAAFEAIEELIGGDATHLFGGLTDDGERRAGEVGEIKVVESSDGGFRWNVNSQLQEGREDVARNEGVGSEVGGWLLLRRETGLNGFKGGCHGGALKGGVGFEAGLGHGFAIALETRVHGEDATGKTHEADVGVAVSNEVLNHPAGAELILHEDGIEGGVVKRTVEDDKLRTAEERAGDTRFAAVGGNQNEAVDVTLEHLNGRVVFGFRIFIRGGHGDRVAALLCNCGDGMSADGEEWVVKIRQNEADGAGAFAAKGTGQFIGAVVELLDGGIDAVSGFLGYFGGAVEDARNGHGAHFSKAGDIVHGGFTLHLIASVAKKTFAHRTTSGRDDRAISQR